MSFKGEIALGALNSKYKYGFTIGDIYRVQGAGNLVPNNLAVANGAFVEWKGTGWEVKKDMQYATSKTGESLDQAVADVLDDHDTQQQDEELTMPAADAANYTVDNYFEQNGEIWKCTAKTDNGDGTWTVEAEKVNGIVPVLNEPNIKNVQADWNQTNTTAKDFIKNKPYRALYNATETLYRVCTGTIEVGGAGIAIMARSSNGVIYGELVWRDNAKLFLKMVNGIYPSALSIRLYVRFVSSSVYVYVRCGSYTQFKLAPLINNPKSAVNFDNFGEVLESLPEGATEVTPVWDASSAGSSGDVPVKSNAYGELVPVTMDNAPTSGSTGLVNSGKLYNVFSDGNGDQLTETPPKQVYVTGKFYFVTGKVCRCTAYSAESATFDVYGVVEAMNYILSQT